MKTHKQFFAVVAVVVMLISLSPVAFAAERDSHEKSISFSNLDQLGINESMEQSVIDSSGNSATVGIERVAGYRSVYSTESTWRVWFSGLTINAEFYMTVSENKVTDVFDDSISVIGGYENNSLTMTSTYGKLTFTAKTLGEIFAAHCWLRGDVTGSNNEINVTWKM